MILPGENKLGDLQLGRSLLEDERRRFWKHRVSQVLWHHISSYHHRLSPISNPLSINVTVMFFSSGERYILGRRRRVGRQDQSPLSGIKWHHHHHHHRCYFQYQHCWRFSKSFLTYFLFLVWRTFSTSPLNPRTLQRFSCFLSRFCRSQIFRFLAVHDMFRYCCCRCSRWRLTMIQQNQ